jgi:hypothetical protein
MKELSVLTPKNLAICIWGFYLVLKTTAAIKAVIVNAGGMIGKEVPTNVRALPNFVR